MISYRDRKQNEIIIKQEFLLFKSILQQSIQSVYKYLERQLAKSSMYSELIQRDINLLRVNRHLRLLWPDYQVRDLLQQRTNLSDLHLITSNPILICKVNLSSKDIPQAILSKNFTHLTVHRAIQLNQDFSPIPHYYAILSKRGFAVDELNSRYVRGSHIITAKIAQLQKQSNLWGAMPLTSEQRVIDSKYIVKRNNMWVLEFESSNPVKSILFYGTIREPRYGKASGYDNELAKDAKLQFCMRMRTFESFLDGFMNNLQEPIQTFHYFTSNYIRKIQMPSLFTSSNKSQKEKEKEKEIEKDKTQQVKSSNSKKKLPFQLLQQQYSNSLSRRPKQYQATITIIQHCLDVQIHDEQTNISQTFQPFNDDHFMSSLLNEIDCNQETKTQLQSFIEKIMQKSEVSLATVQKASQFKQISSNQSYSYVISIMTKIFIANNSKDIEIWVQLYNNIKNIAQYQVSTILIKKLEHYLINNYRQFLKNCLDEDIYQSLGPVKHSLRRQIARNLSNCQNESGQLSDMLYILMNVEGKKDILQLYDLYRLSDAHVYFGQSLRNYQTLSCIVSKDNSNLLYENSSKIGVVQYNPINQEKNVSKQQYINSFSLYFNYYFPRQSFLSGKILQIGNLMFKYYVWRDQEYIYCFFQKITNQSNKMVNHLQTIYSFQIQMQISIENIKKKHNFSWNFASPSHSIGYRYIIEDPAQQVLIAYKTTFKRAIFHQSMLNYFKIRYQQSISSQSEQRQRLHSYNKKLSCRRSSLYLQKNILGLESSQLIDKQCFYHINCEKCSELGQQNFIYRLLPLDTFSLLFSIRFHEETDALQIIFKYILFRISQQNNDFFWVSLLRFRYLSLTTLLKAANNYTVSPRIKPILNSLIEQKIIESCSGGKKIIPKFIFINGQLSRRGETFWRWIQKDYSQQYLQYLNNALQKL